MDYFVLHGSKLQLTFRFYTSLTCVMQILGSRIIESACMLKLYIKDGWLQNEFVWKNIERKTILLLFLNIRTMEHLGGMNLDVM